jgi:succinate dehydrogenase/fumarate reductase cytochrome b subunit
MIWLIIKGIFVVFLTIFAIFFAYHFMIGFKEATARFFNYSLKHLVQKKNNDGLLYELERTKKEYKI